MSTEQPEASTDDAPTTIESGDNMPAVVLVDAVELALADAITKAATAGAFDVLPALVAELAARRAARGEPKN